MTEMKTLNSQMLGFQLANLPSKPVYVYCAYNHYRVLTIHDAGDYYLLISPEEEGCWQHSSTIKDSVPEVKETKIEIEEDDDGPEVA